MTSRENLQNRISEIEQLMNQADFWSDKNRAQAMIRELQNLKDEISGIGKHDRRDAILTIFSGAGGDDAEDWSRMLFEMYLGFAKNKNLGVQIISENRNDHGGFRTVTVHISGKNAYGILKNESGVHRLVRISPFNSQGKRQTSFSMVEVLPKFDDDSEIKISPDEIEIEYTKSSGPGGQNVNKRETAVRIKHKSTGISVVASTERSQAQNKEVAMEILRGKIFNLKEKEERARDAGLSVSSTTENEWGSQIRSYVLHPYKMVKDHRSNFETSNIDKILSGDLDEIIESLG